MKRLVCLYALQQVQDALNCVCSIEKTLGLIAVKAPIMAGVAKLCGDARRSIRNAFIRQRVVRVCGSNARKVRKSHPLSIAGAA